MKRNNIYALLILALISTSVFLRAETLEIISTVKATDKNDVRVIWNPVIYPTNSATVYGIVTINGVTLTSGDMVAAFAGTECRGTSTIVVNNGQAFTALLVNLVSPGDTVTFKVYDASVDSVYNASNSQVLSYGQILGDATPYPISNMPIVYIDAPVITIMPYADGFRINWAPVINADRYKVISKQYTDSPDSIVYEVTDNYYNGIINYGLRLFRVIAVHDDDRRGAE